MKKGVTFFVFICLLVFGVSACGRENVSDPSEGKKASAENPKTTDRSSEESEQTSEQTEASVSAALFRCFYLSIHFSSHE